MNTLTLTVPFVYAAMVVKPRCRKPVMMKVKDSVLVEIPCLSIEAAPVAIIACNRQLRWFGERLWDFYETSVARELPRQVSIDTVRTNTENGGITYIYSSSGAEAPFKRFWSSIYAFLSTDPMSNIKDAWLTDVDVVERADIAGTIVDDNRDVILRKACDIADGLLFVGGTLCKAVDEPVYTVDAYSLGHTLHTELAVQFGCSKRNIDAPVFNALQLQEVCDYGIAVAKNRGDIEGVANFKDPKHVITVLIPEAIRIPARQKQSVTNVVKFPDRHAALIP